MDESVSLIKYDERRPLYAVALGSRPFSPSVGVESPASQTILRVLTTLHRVFTAANLELAVTPGARGGP